jgi:hypothetical protein
MAVDDLDYDVQPVDHDPFGPMADSPQNYDVAPVDHDPFASAGGNKWAPPLSRLNRVKIGDQTFVGGASGPGQSLVQTAGDYAGGGPVQLNAELRHRLALLSRPRHGLAEGGAPDDQPQHGGYEDGGGYMQPAYPGAHVGVIGDIDPQSDIPASEAYEPSPIGSPVAAAMSPSEKLWGGYARSVIGMPLKAQEYARKFGTGLLNSLGVFHDVATGQASMAEPETQRRTMDVAGMVTLGPGALEAEAPEGALTAGAARRAPKPPSPERVAAVDAVNAAQARLLHEDVAQLGNYTPVPEAPPHGLTPEGTQNVGANVRDLSHAGAIAKAETDPHLMRDVNRGPNDPYYVGGPTTVLSPADLTALRQRNYGYLASMPGGWDWYKRIREDIRGLTAGAPPPGNQLPASTWTSKMEGQWSAQRPPGTEFGMSQKERSGMIAGMPQQANTEAQHNAFVRAIESGDPNEMQLGLKTGKYAELIDPERDFLPPQATGVNDFRYATQWGYHEPDGSPWDRALSEAQHRFIDNETARMVKWANDNNIGGKRDWTGEEVQAAIWTRQKAEQRLRDSPGAVEDYIKDGMSPDEAYQAAFRNDAWPMGNATLREHFGNRTIYTTHEAQPGIETGHLPDAANMTSDQRQQFADNPLSSWLTPSGHDALYSGLGVAGSPQISMLGQPALKGMGIYQGPSGVLEFNPVTAGRVIRGFGPEGRSELNPADRAIMSAGETLRAAIDTQNASAAHTPFFDVPASKANGFRIPMSRAPTPEEIQTITQIGEKYGTPYASHTGDGLTLSNFGDPVLNASKVNQFKAELKNAIPWIDTNSVQHAYVDGVNMDLVRDWAKQGSGRVTRKIIKAIAETPELEEAFSQHPYLSQIVNNRIQRDMGQAGARKDESNLRAIIGMGGGWPSRLRQALKPGGLRALSAAAAAAGYTLYPEAGLPAELSGQPAQNDNVPSSIQLLRRQRAMSAQ